MKASKGHRKRKSSHKKRRSGKKASFGKDKHKRRSSKKLRRSKKQQPTKTRSPIPAVARPLDETWPKITVFKYQMPSRFAVWMETKRQEDPAKFDEIMEYFKLTEPELEAMKSKEEASK